MRKNSGYVLLSWLLIAGVTTGGVRAKAEEILLKDKSFTYKMNLDKKTGKIRLKTIKGESGLPNSPAILVTLSDKEKTEVQLRLVSGYENKNPQFEGYLGPSSGKLLGVELSLVAKNGLLHKLRWKFNREK